MITARTTQALDEAFTRALQENSDPAHAVQVGPPPLNVRTPPSRDSRRLFVLTIAAHAFRVVVLLDFVLDAATRTYFSSLFHKHGKSVSDQEITDILSEYTNMVCGTANRMFSTTALRTGMSTPCLLEDTCSAQVRHLNPAHTSTLRVDLDARTTFSLTLCLCAADDSQIDLNLDIPAQEAASGGELELF